MSLIDPQLTYTSGCFRDVSLAFLLDHSLARFLEHRPHTAVRGSHLIVIMQRVAVKPL